MKKLILLLALIPSIISAQNSFFHKWEISATAGSTGVGIDVASPINEHLTARVGFQYLPTISIKKPYSMSSVGTVGQNLTPEEQAQKMDHLCEFLGEMINSDKVDSKVDMAHQLNFKNARVLIDWHPFHNKNWYFTTGVFIGPKKIARAINTNKEAPTMLAVKMYNTIYDQIKDLEEWEYPTLSLGSYSFELDPITGTAVKDRFMYYGSVAVQMGTFPDGTPHYLTPDDYGLMQVKATTSMVKPYVGFGYEHSLDNDKRWYFSFNFGTMIFGKAPHIICDDGVCLTHDVEGINGEVGDMLKIIKNTVVYPNLEIRLAYRIF